MKILTLKSKLILTFVLSMVFGLSFAQYSISKYSINSGGGKMSGGQFEMQGSIGQADASNIMTNGDFSINGGFWHQNNDLIFRNGFE